MLFAGDLFDAIPFSTQPTVVVEGNDDDGEHKHYVGEIEWAYGRRTWTPAVLGSEQQVLGRRGRAALDPATIAWRASSSSGAARVRPRLP
jgi:hypothetical protein